MKFHPNYTSEEDLLKYKDGINDGFRLDSRLGTTDPLLQSLKALILKESELQPDPYLAGVLAGIVSRNYQLDFLRDIELQRGRGKIDPDLDL